MSSRAGEEVSRRSLRPGEAVWPRTLATAMALAAANAVDLERRVGTLLAAATGLRAMGPGRIVATLLDDDTLAGCWPRIP